MRTGVLFEITQDQLDTGLRGVPVGHCVTSSVDPLKGLTYAGRPISELAYFDPLSAIYPPLLRAEWNKGAAQKLFERRFPKRKLPASRAPSATSNRSPTEVTRWTCTPPPF